MEFLMRLPVFSLLVSIVVIQFFFLPAMVSAQLSPGELHQSHAFLEGVGNCTKCHGTGQEVLAQNCLSCHSTIKTSLEQRTGLHGRNDYTECNLCHVEHQGRDFDLVYWKDGREKFDHAQTGYPLEGKHTAVACEKCHRPENMLGVDGLRADKRTLERSYLGLDTACSGCHFDEHRGQVSKDCQNCHTLGGWKPATRFDHNNAKFVLTGKHKSVLCEKCHKSKSEPANPQDTLFAQFTGISFQACTDCHRDAHQGKLGANCTGCHTTESWKSSNRANFDHNRTKFPLLGKHAGLSCEKCHKPGQPFAGLQYDKCRACHEDYHRGEFARRPAAGACEECHTVEGFRPAKFTIEQHQECEYPLTGAHLAVPCDLCHRDAKDKSARVRFAFAATDCEACHGDPHQGSQKLISDAKTCEGCHKTEGWGQVAFDHNKTKFPLIGKHAGAACRNCHSADPASFDPATMKFVLTNYACADCHQDIHRGQFASAMSSPATDCARCHFSTTWKELNFDHNRDSAYKLEGAHSKVPCQLCHRQESTDSGPIVRYKPIGTDCKTCHDTELLQNHTRP